MNAANCLHGRGATELRVIGALSAVWPFETDDATWSASHGVDTWKRKYPELVEPVYRMTPEHAAAAIVDCVLSKAGAL